MPVILRHKGFRFFFYSNEGRPLEPAHIHVRHREFVAKFWLLPEIGLAENFGFTAGQISEILDLIADNHDLLKGKWYEYFGS
jgi:hypothetical protein